MIRGTTQLIGVIGDPIRHSLSPVMHNSAFAHLEMDCCCVPFHVTGEDAVEWAVKGIKALNLVGINVTSPHKEAVMPYLDQISDHARIIGAVNTIRREGEALVGYNTDADGFIKSVTEHCGSLKGAHVTLLGAGGAARGILHSLAKEGLGRLVLANRTVHKVEDLAQELMDYYPDLSGKVQCAPLQVEPLKEPFKASDLVINTLPRDPQDESGNWLVPIDELQVEALAIDLRYHPKETAFLSRCREEGLNTQNGLGMLLYQGVLAFELFFKRQPPVDIMRRALEAHVYSE